MSDQVVKWEPREGGMNKDLDVSLLTGGDYEDALNMRPLTDAGQQSFTRMNVIGNKFVYRPTNVERQNKRVTIAFNVSTPAPATLTATFKASGNGLPIVSTFVAVSSDVSTTMDNAAFAFASDMQSNGFDAYDFVKVVDNADFGNLTFTLGGLSEETEGIDWLIQLETGMVLISVVEESIPEGLAGELHPIESIDLLGDLFTWWTPNTELPSTLNIVSSTNTSPIEVLFDQDHGLQDGGLIVISGHLLNTNANGKWIVKIGTSASVFLTGSQGTTPGGNTGIGTINAFGVGEIGVSQKDLNTGVWTYFRLLRSVQFNFSTKHQPIAKADKNSLRIELYWVDKYNVPRVLYYKGPYIQDGALNDIDPLNEYDYLTLDEATTLIRREPDVTFDFVSQPQTGGSLLSGNWRYAVAFGAGEGFTPYSKLSNPVPVYSAPLDFPISVVGDQAGVITTKINQLLVSGIPSFYTTMRIVGVNYVNGAVTGYIVKDQDITGDDVDGVVAFSHTGDEPSIADFDLQNLFIQLPEIESAGLIETIDNRMLLADIVLQADPDLSDFADTIEHSLLRSTVQSVGSGLDFTQGEYMMPENVFYNTSYLLNETYRFGVRLRNNKTKIWTEVYFVQDITFNDDGAYSRRNAAIPDYSLTTTAASPGDRVDVYYYYIQFTNVNFDFVLDSGQVIRDIYDKIEFVRSEVVIPTILNTGVLLLKSDVTDFVNLNYYYNNAPVTANTPQIPYPGAPTDAQRRIGVFYSPDIKITGGTITFQTGDQILNFGNPEYIFDRYTGNTISSNLSILADTYGALDVFDSHDLANVQPISGGQSLVISGNNLDGKLQADLNIANTFAFVISTTYLTNINPGTGDYGAYLYQYYRPNTDQYGNEGSTSYIEINASFEIGADTTATTYDVFGGDVFTQKTYLRIGVPAPGTGGWGNTFGFYSQNRINSQLRSITGLTNSYVYPRGNGIGGVPDQRIDQVNSINNTEPLLYNRGYNYPELLETLVAFDSTAQYIYELNTRIYYSQLKPDQSVSDEWRQYLPLNFKDLDASNGSITGLWRLQGELYTNQVRAFCRQFFNARGQMNAGLAGEVVIGDGTVFSRDGIVLSTVGCNHRFAQTKGRTESGNDTLYWINTPLKKFARFGVDGNVNLSDVRGMRSWIAKAVNFVNNFDMPAAGIGIHGCWWERYAEVHFTVMGYNTSIIPYSPGTPYSPGNVVSYVSPNEMNQQFEQTPEFYKRIGLGTTTGVGPTDTTKWARVPHTDLNYYDQYTLVFNEVTNKFQTYYSHKPPIYFEWQDGILSPRPISFFASIYEHDRGDYNDWYEQAAEPTGGTIEKIAGSLIINGASGTLFQQDFIDGFGITVGGLTFTVNQIVNNGRLIVDKRYRLADGSYSNDGAAIAIAAGTNYGIISRQCENGYITSVVNVEPNISKTWLAQQFNTEIIPKRTDYTTMNDTSFNEEDQFTTRVNMYPVPIRNAADAAGVVTGDTSKMWGNYLITKFRFKRTEFQKLTDYMTKFYFNARTNQK